MRGKVKNLVGKCEKKNRREKAFLEEGKIVQP